MIHLNDNHLTILNETIEKISITTNKEISVKILNCTVKHGIDINAPNGRIQFVGDSENVNIVDINGKRTA